MLLSKASICFKDHRDQASLCTDSGLFILCCSLFILKWPLEAVVQSTDERESRWGTGEVETGAL